MKRITVGAWISGLAVACVIGCGAAPSGATPPEPAPEEVRTAKLTQPEPPRQTTQPAKPGRKDNAYRLYQLSGLQQVTVKIDGKSFRVWVMDTFSKQQEGMMFLKDDEVRADEGMIFVYNEPGPRSFWMRNTYLALDIVFIGNDKRILNIAAAKPLDETGVPSKGQARWVLEFKQGTMKRHGITEGAKVEIPDLKFKSE